MGFLQLIKLNALHMVQVDIRFNKDPNLTYSVSYTPRIEGLHKVKILYAGRQIPKSPYSVLVEGHAGDLSKVTAAGPGLMPEGVVVNRPTYFDIFSKDAVRVVPEVIILDPQVKNHVQYHFVQTCDQAVQHFFMIGFKNYCPCETAANFPRCLEM